MMTAITFAQPVPGQFTLDSYKKHFSDFLDWLKQSVATQSVATLVKARAGFIDKILAQLWRHYQLDRESGLALIAVGGYGRGELHPYSDIDLLILTDSRLSKSQQEQIGQFITVLWDLRLEVGHSVRTIKETISIGREDITVATNLLEMRFLTGNTQLFDELSREVTKDNFWPSKDFFQAKRQEQQSRHAQYHGTAYNLEPNLKANPGGLRDIQTIGWVAKKHFRTRTMRELVAHQYLTEDEYQEVKVICGKCALRYIWLPDAMKIAFCSIISRQWRSFLALAMMASRRLNA
jgi:[protein-PII] uridylyltransferase